MLATLAVSCALAVLAPTAPKQSAASQLVSKMLQYYSSAQSLTGTILFTASDGAGKAQLLTTIQYEKPSKLYILQEKRGSQPMQWIVSSDGKYFSYAPPEYLASATFNSKPQRLIEPINQIVPGEFLKNAAGKTVPKYAPYDVRQIYAVAASSLGDRSVPLDIAVGRTEDLKHDVLTWMTVIGKGKTTLNGVEANLIVGGWRPYGEAIADPNNPPGTYELYITDEGKLLRYTVTQLLGEAGNPTRLQETWDVGLTLNGKPDQNLFRLVR